MLNEKSLQAWLSGESAIKPEPLKPSPYTYDLPPAAAPRPLEYWQVIELATVRQLSEMRAAESRRKIERSVATLAAIGEPRYQKVSR